MASIHVRRQHTVGKERARTIVSDLARQLGSSLGITYEWNGDMLTFNRSDVRGRIHVEDTAVTVDAELGGMLGLFKGKVEQEVKAYLDEKMK